LIMLMIMVRLIGNARLVVCGAPRWFHSPKPYLITINI